MTLYIDKLQDVSTSGVVELLVEDSHAGEDCPGGLQGGGQTAGSVPHRGTHGLNIIIRAVHSKYGVKSGI